jgi:hypothetical protein
MKVPRIAKVHEKNDSVFIGVEELGGWEIYSKKISNQNQLELFIKKTFGEDCVLGTMRSYPQLNGYQVEIDMIDHGFADTKCLLRGSGWYVYYDSKKNTVVYWEWGQETRLGDYEGPMLESFNFLP